MYTISTGLQPQHYPSTFVKIVILSAIFRPISYYSALGMVPALGSCINSESPSKLTELLFRNANTLCL